MSYTVLNADLANDKEDILTFWKTNFPRWPQRKYTWFYKNNPYGPATCFILKQQKQNMVIGSTALFPRRVFIRGQYVMGGITGDFAIDKKHRILGPALKLQKTLIPAFEDDQYDFLYGYPNVHSQPVQKRAGFRILGSAVRMVKILKSYHYLIRFVKVPLLAKLLSVPVDAILNVFAKEHRYRISKDLQAETIKTFDNRFDKLWNKTVHNFSFIGERTSQFLKWRFVECPYNKYNIFTLKKKENDELLGYVVYYLAWNDAHIADFLAVDNTKMLDILLASFLKFSRRSGYQTVSIVYFGNKLFMRKFEEFNFSRRADERNIVVYVNSSASFADYVMDPNKWYFLEADND